MNDDILAGQSAFLHRNGSSSLQRRKVVGIAIGGTRTNGESACAVCGGKPCRQQCDSGDGADPGAQDVTHSLPP